MPGLDEQRSAYQFPIMLRHINPPVWRRILIGSESSLATLHDTLQIVCDWSDPHLHRFLLHGKEYGVGRAGCTSFRRTAANVRLAEVGFRPKERFLYEYDCGDLWQHQIRFEQTQSANTVVNEDLRTTFG
ncbi:MAG: plasmid pRiA4b ORF-3 family protein [Nitrospirota bacterium]|nr:plasmid pRiA4b ORF-3 family protein [Nitrospirota bacterium]